MAIVEAVGVAAHATASGRVELAREIETAMQKAIELAITEGIALDSPDMKARIMAARETVLARNG